jgi:hypothetical protein
MLRHFELNPQILIEEVLSKGYNQKQVSDAINLPGSRFYSSFANDIPTLLEKVFTIGFEQSTGAKVGKRQLKRELEKVAENWKDIKVSEINLVKITVEKSAETGAEMTVTLSAVEVAKKVGE